MKTPTIVTAKNFNTKLSSVTSRNKTARADLQALLVFGLDHYQKVEDTVYLTKAVKACVGVGSLNTALMIAFLQAHANIAWTKIEIKSGANKGGTEHVFKKKGQHAEVTLPEMGWWEFEKPEADKPARDVYTMLVNFRKTVAKEIEAGHVTDKKQAILILEGLDFEINNINQAMQRAKTEALLAVAA